MLIGGLIGSHIYMSYLDFLKKEVNYFFMNVVFIFPTIFIEIKFCAKPSARA